MKRKDMARQICIIKTYYDAKIARDAKDPNWYNVPKQEMA